MPVHAQNRIVGPRNGIPVLTERQTEALMLVLDGLTDEEVAERMGITRRSVRHHLTRCKNRLGGADNVNGLRGIVPQLIKAGVLVWKWQR